ncbi:hypothetical protein COCNU_03G004500 [Cocos nucifera]|uniref:Uncharacterized protein n=1 Tax=Cocos nucifera TaxID=13894 RepID=A0A8K0MYV4_COCNU|nr:hypothetical protein COCNU_03G004500 [Cocos nucifera]
MAPTSSEEFLLAAPQIARTRGPDPNLVGKFALIVAAGGLMMGYDRHRRRRRHHHLDLAFQVYLFADIMTFVLGLLLKYRLMAAPPDSTTTGNGKITTWVTLFMSVVTLALGSFLLIFANCHA